jgi:hypothetical protein
MAGDRIGTTDSTRFERLVAVTALAAAPVMIAVGLVAMFVSPHEFAESDTATGWGLWLGAILGLMAMVVYALPQPLFGLELRSGTRGKLKATAIGAAFWVWLGLQPLAAGLVGGWSGLAPVAVVMVAAAGVLDGCVCVVAVRRLRRLGAQPPNRAVIPRT